MKFDFEHINTFQNHLIEFDDDSKDFEDGKIISDKDKVQPILAAIKCNF